MGHKRIEKTISIVWVKGDADKPPYHMDRGSGFFDVWSNWISLYEDVKFVTKIDKLTSDDEYASIICKYADDPDYPEDGETIWDFYMYKDTSFFNQLGIINTARLEEVAYANTYSAEDPNAYTWESVKDRYDGRVDSFEFIFEGYTEIPDESLIKFKIVDQDGNPVQGAYIRAVDNSASYINSYNARQRTNSEGIAYTYTSADDIISSLNYDQDAETTSYSFEVYYHEEDYWADVPPDAVITAFVGFGEIADTGSTSITIPSPDTSITEIYTAEDLSNIRNNLNGNYKLMNDINLEGENWIPIGDYWNNEKFTGVLDGQEFTITNLTIDMSTNTHEGYYYGLFDFESHAEIKNIIFENVNITGYSGDGAGVFGYAHGCVFDNVKIINSHVENYNSVGLFASTLICCDLNDCHVDGSVLMNIDNGAYTGYSGGFSASINSCTLDYCTCEVDLSTPEDVEGEIFNIGGFAGRISASEIINRCSFDGSMNLSLDQWSFNLGLFTGSFSSLQGDDNLLISNCYAKGTMNGTDFDVGGFVGSVETEENTIIEFENCYSAVTITEALESGRTESTLGFVFGNIDSDHFNISGFYYDKDLAELGDGTDAVSGDMPDILVEERTTEEMTFPHAENTYIDWDFQHMWDIRNDKNDGYPDFRVIKYITLNWLASVDIDFVDLKSHYYIRPSFEIETELQLPELKRWFPIVRTNSAFRGDNNTAEFSGTLVDPGPYNEELWSGDIEGFFEYQPEFFGDLDDTLVMGTTPGEKLPDLDISIYSAFLSESINSSQDIIPLESIPAEFPEGGFCYIADGYNTEYVEYGGIEANSLINVVRGIYESPPRSFAAGSVVYYITLERSLTYEESVFPIGLRESYNYRAGIKVRTNINGTSKSFKFYGATRTLGEDESEELSGLDRGELFLDARDLDNFDLMLDRAKLKFEEMEFEGWNTEEFKNWVWDEFSNIGRLYFDQLTLAELIKIAAGITDYTEAELFDMEKEDIENIIRNKLDNVTSAEIDTWAFDVSKLVVRLLTGEPAGAYNDWTEQEVKDFLKLMLTNEMSYSDFEDNFPFDKWESMMKSKLNISINNNASIEVEYNQYGPYNYMIDFQLGDIIVVEYPGVFRAMTRIIEVKEEHTVNEGKKYTLTLGKEFETLIGRMKSDQDNISGRL